MTARYLAYCIWGFNVVLWLGLVVMWVRRIWSYRRQRNFERECEAALREEHQKYHDWYDSLCEGDILVYIPARTESIIRMDGTNKVVFGHYVLLPREFDFNNFRVRERPGPW